MDEADTTQTVARPAVLGVMRGLAIAALGIAVFLAFFDVWYMIDATRTKVPFCSWAPDWFDCGAVVFHPKWSNWLGVPVAALALPVYLAVTVGLFVARPKPAQPQRKLWLMLHTAAIAVLGAAAWFVYLQLVQIGKVCQYCMAEHAIGAVLALMLVAHAKRVLPRGRSTGTLVAMAGLAVLIAGQLVFAPPVMTRVIVGTVGADKKYVEPEATVDLAGGFVRLNATAHPVLGSPDAKHVIVEAIDYTCPRCRALFEMLEPVKSMLGGDYAVLVLTYPLSHRCNPHQIDTEERHRDACDLAKLAHAVWLTDPAKYAEFHRWLFANQDDMTAVKAIDYARSLVDPSRLDGYRADAEGKPVVLMKRDIDIAHRLDVSGLPGLFAGDQRFGYLPDSPAELADLLRKAFEE